MTEVNPDSEDGSVPVNDRLKARAKELGFSLVGIAPAARPDTLDHFREWLRQGFQGSMDYMLRREQAYEHPQNVQVGVRSLVIVGLNYGPGQENPGQTGKVAAYAQGVADYHDVLREKLQLLAASLRSWRPAARTRVAVDTAPVLERDAARRAGLGWFGKNTLLINKWQGSYFFIGALLTDLELTPDTPHTTDHCGTCTRCLDACPTDAFPSPHVLDATRCISYLTIELRNEPIPRELRNSMEDWLFGCDACQQVCPWNRKSTPTTEPAITPIDPEFRTAELLLNLSEDEFRHRFQQTPLARPGRIGIARNAAIVLGNRRNPQDVPRLVTALSADSPLIRGAAAWALGEIGNSRAIEALDAARHTETDLEVRTEIEFALGRASTS